MKILSRYLAREFLIPLGLSILAFLMLVSFSEVFEQLEHWNFHNTPAHIAAVYIIYRLPEWLVKITPVAVLLATTFSLAQLHRTNQITAMRVSGLSLFQIIAPYSICAFGISIAILLMSETVVPIANMRVNYISQVVIKGKTSTSPMKLNNIILDGHDGRKFNVQYVDGEKGLVRDISIDRIAEPAVLIQHIYAKEAFWDDLSESWTLKSGVIRNFDSSGRSLISEEAFAEKEFMFPETLDDFFQRQKKPEEMNYGDLRAYIRRLDHLGISVQKEKVVLQSKLSFPFANIIILMIGIPFAMKTSKTSSPMGIFLSLAVSFLYWGTISLGEALGQNYLLHPIVAAWFGNIIFAAVGLVLISKTPR